MDKQTKMTFPQVCARSTERHCIHGFNNFFAQELNVCIALRWKLLVCLPAMFSLNHFFFFFFFLRYCKVYEMQATNTLSPMHYFVIYLFQFCSIMHLLILQFSAPLIRFWLARWPRPAISPDFGWVAGEHPWTGLIFTLMQVIPSLEHEARN